MRVGGCLNMVSQKETGALAKPLSEAELEHLRSEFEKLYREYYPSSYQFGRNRFPHIPAIDMEDIVSNVWIRVWVKLCNGKIGANLLYRYLRNAIRNASIDYLRSHRANHLSLEEWSEHTNKEPVDPTPLFENSWSALDQAMRHLRGQDRRVLRLREEGLTRPQMAKETNKRDPAIGSALYRAQRRLFTNLESLGLNSEFTYDNITLHMNQPVTGNKKSEKVPREGTGDIMPKVNPFIALPGCPFAGTDVPGLHLFSEYYILATEQFEGISIKPRGAYSILSSLFTKTAVVKRGTLKNIDRAMRAIAIRLQELGREQEIAEWQNNLATLIKEAKNSKVEVPVAKPGHFFDEIGCPFTSAESMAKRMTANGSEPGDTEEFVRVLHDAFNSKVIGRPHRNLVCAVIRQELIGSPREVQDYWCNRFDLFVPGVPPAETPQSTWVVPHATPPKPPKIAAVQAVASPSSQTTRKERSIPPLVFNGVSKNHSNGTPSSFSPLLCQEIGEVMKMLLGEDFVDRVLALQKACPHLSPETMNFLDGCLEEEVKRRLAMRQEI